MRSKIILRAAVMAPVACLALAVCVAAKAQISSVAILTKQNATNGTPDPLGFTQQFDVDAVTGIQSISVAGPGNLSLTLTPDDGIETQHWEFDSANYSNVTALRAVYGTGNYTFTIHYPGNVTDTATLAFNPSQPSEFIQPTCPAANATGVPYLAAPTFTWPLDSADSNCMLDFELDDASGNGIAKNAPVPMDILSWTPSVSLAPATQYGFQLGVYGGTMAQMYTNNLDTPFQYYGVFGNVNDTPFTTAAAPEPGTLCLLAAGAAAWWLRRRLSRRAGA
jgi:hypothetical protein